MSELEQNPRRNQKEEGEGGVGGAFNILSLGMGLTRSQQQLIIRAGWVIIVSTHILWVCGLLVPIGLSAPFAKADAVEDLKRVASVTARLQLTQEMRTQTLYLCASKDSGQRQMAEQTLDRLKDEYRQITHGEQPPEFKCP